MASEPDPHGPPTGITPMAAFALAFGALLGLGGVTLGAYAAHGAAPDLRAGLETASLYALIHGLALMAAALIHDRATGGTGTHRAIAHLTAARRVIALSMLALALGTLFFSGGIFLAALGHNPGTAPLGGILLIGGWLGLVVGAGVLVLAPRRD